MPPDVREWLPPRHLAWFVMDAVDEMDLEAFYGAYRTKARERMARATAGTLRSVEGEPKSPQDQLHEIEKLVTDAARLLDQALFALGTVAARLKDEPEEKPEG